MMANDGGGSPHDLVVQTWIMYSIAILLFLVRLYVQPFVVQRWPSFVGIISNKNTGLPATSDSDFDSRLKITSWWSLW